MPTLVVNTVVNNRVSCDTLGVPRRASKSQTEDINEAAARITDNATGSELRSAKNPAAVVLGRLGASKGGKARASRLSKKRRVEIAKQAARARWEGPPQ